MSRWFRHYAGMMRDEKLVRVAMKSGQPVERVLWVWGAILESAAEVSDGGRYDFDTDEGAYFLRCDPADVVAICDALESLGRIDGGCVARWGDRQFESDASRERQKRYRNRRKLESDGDVTSRDAKVTLQETETETETDSSSSLRSDETRALKGDPVSKPVQKKRASRIPDDWEPDFAQAAEIGLSQAQASVEADKFRDYWRGKSGANATKADWPATWRNWCRTAVERLPQARGSPANPQPNSAIAYLDKRIEELKNGSAASRPDGIDPGADGAISGTFRRLSG